jgi:excisionase family DNA binding protein
VPKRTRRSTNKPDHDASRAADQLLTVNQLAALWQVHPRTIRRLIKKKRLSVIRIDRSIRIHPDIANLDSDSVV